MRIAYPIVITREDDGYTVFIPDFEIGTQGDSIAEALYMARDAIGLFGIDMEDDGKQLPEPSEILSIKSEYEGQLTVLVDVDFAEYRRRQDMRAVKKNCTVPSWLASEAEKAGINFSAVLQAGLKRELHLSEQ